MCWDRYWEIKGAEYASAGRSRMEEDDEQIDAERGEEEVDVYNNAELRD